MVTQRSTENTQSDKEKDKVEAWTFSTTPAERGLKPILK
jgi:hypothetical protein